MAADPSVTSAQQKRADRERLRREAELSCATMTGSAGGGLVQLQIDGLYRVHSLQIAPEVFEGRDPDLLADLIMAALADGQRRVTDRAFAVALDGGTSSATRSP